MQATVFADVDNSMKLAQEEIFGPVLAVIPFDDVDDALAKANDVFYGLASGVWTRDLKKAHTVSRRLQAGTVWINCYHVFDSALPFGGYKQSGWGREMGQAVLSNYLETKAITTSIT